MALTTSKIREDYIGGIKLQIHDLTFTSVTGGRISTGLNNVLAAIYVPSTSDDHGITYSNFSDAGSTSSFGDVYVDAVTQNDTGKLIVFGV